jgi:galactokinase
VEAFKKDLAGAYLERFGIEPVFYEVRASDGASRIT